MICESCRHAARLWQGVYCQVKGGLHQTGETVKACERNIRRNVEQAGGTGQLLALITDEHRNFNRASIIYKVTELHGPYKCLGGTYCDCQHRLPG